MQIQSMTMGKRAPQWLALLAIIMLASNLRPAVISVGPALGAISSTFGFNASAAGGLTTLPTICFALFGLLAPAAARQIGLHTTLMVGLAMILIGQIIRVVTASPVVFLTATVVALMGVASGNVLLPALVRRHFPDRIGLISGLYATAMALGLATASFATVPLSSAIGGSEGWRLGVGAWALLAFVGLIPWLGLIGQDRRLSLTSSTTRETAISIAQVARTRVGWAMALFFGIQGAHAYAIFGWLPSIYASAGFSPRQSGSYLGVVTTAAIPLAFIFPAYAARRHRPVGLMVVISTACCAGYLGLLLAPTQLPWLWALLLAVGTSAFPVTLALIGLRARSGAGTAALSGFAQSVGYVISAPGPLLVGVLFQATGTWTVPLLFLIILTGALLVTAIVATKPVLVEDAIATP